MLLGQRPERTFVFFVFATVIKWSGRERTSQHRFVGINAY